MTRKKPLGKLRKIDIQKAYLQVYDEFRQELFPGIAQKRFNNPTTKVVHKNVLRKRKRVLKETRFKFLPTLRPKES